MNFNNAAKLNRKFGERSGGTCVSAHLSWNCFSKETLMSESRNDTSRLAKKLALPHFP